MSTKEGNSEIGYFFQIGLTADIDENLPNKILMTGAA